MLIRLIYFGNKIFKQKTCILILPWYCQASVFSHLNKNLKRRTLEPSACHSSWTDCVIALRSRTDCVIALRSVLQLSVIAQFYLENSRKIHPRGMRACRPKDAKRRERGSAPAHRRERDPRPFGSSFYMFFSSPLGLRYVNWASQECCLFYLRSSLQSSDLPLFYFHRLFPSLSFSHCRFDSCFLF